MPPEDGSPVGANPSSSQSLSQPQRKRSLQEIYGTNWLLRLPSLPLNLYRGAVDRLAPGASVWGVARWLISQPDRGRLPSFGYILRMII